MKLLTSIALITAFYLFSCSSVSNNFNEAFKACEKADTTVTLGKITYKYTILGSSAENGCKVQSEFISHPNSKWVGKKMICNLDNSIDFQSALIEPQKNIDCCNCEGELKNLLSGKPVESKDGRGSNRPSPIKNIENWDIYQKPKKIYDIEHQDSIVILATDAGIVEINLNKTSDIKVHNKANAGIPSQEVLSVLVDQNQKIWAVSPGSPRPNEKHPYLFSLDGDYKNLDFFLNSDANLILDNKNGNYIWLTKPSNNNLLKYSIDDNLKKVSAAAGYGVYLNDYFWIPSDSGIVRFDGESNYKVVDTCCSDYKLTVADNSIWAFKNTRKEAWVYDADVFRLTEDQKLEPFPFENPYCDPKSTEIIGIYNDFIWTRRCPESVYNRKKDKWLENEEGTIISAKDNLNNLWFYNKTSGILKNLNENISVDLSKTIADDFMIMEGNDLSLSGGYKAVRINDESWAVARRKEDKGIILSHKKGQSVRDLVIPEKISQKASGAYISTTDIAYLGVEEDRSVWLVTEDGLIGKLDQNEKWSYFEPFLNGYKDIEVSGAEISNNESIYLTTNKGLFKYSVSNKKLKYFDGVAEAILKEEATDESFYSVSKVHIDNDSNIWLTGVIAREKDGPGSIKKPTVMRINKDGVRMFNVADSDLTRRFLISNAAVTDESGNLWVLVGTSKSRQRIDSEGLAKLSPQGKWEKLFTYKNSPIPQGELKDIKIDKEGVIWIRTKDGGVVRFEPNM